MDSRDEETATAGRLLIRMGGEVRELPTLKIEQSRKWKAKLATLAGQITDRLPDGADNATFFRSLLDMPSDVMVELVVAYDQSNVLGGKRWIEKNADDREVFDALQQMVAATFPFGRALLSVVEASGLDLRGMAPAFLKSVGSSLANSTNGRSHTGDSTLTELPSVSATNSS